MLASRRWSCRCWARIRRTRTARSARGSSGGRRCRSRLGCSCCALGGRRVRVGRLCVRWIRVRWVCVRRVRVSWTRFWWIRRLWVRVRRSLSLFH